MALDDRFDRREIVVAGEQRVGGSRRRNAGARRHAERQRAGARLHQERVRVPVVAALELDDPVAFRGRARDANRAHRRFGAGADESDALHRRHQHRDALRQPRLELGWRAEAGAARRRRGQRLEQALRRVAVDQRPPRHHVVDVACCRRRPRCARRCARAMKSGVAPTALKARTGLSTPPGRTRDAAVKRRSDCWYRRVAIRARVAVTASRRPQTPRLTSAAGAPPGIPSRRCGSRGPACRRGPRRSAGSARGRCRSPAVWS